MADPILISNLPAAAPELGGSIIHNTVAGATSQGLIEDVLGLLPVASSADINTGTEASKPMTPDAFAGSNAGIRLVVIKVFDDTTLIEAGDGKVIFCIPAELNGMNLVSAHGFVSTVGTGATLINVQIRNVTQAVDMLSTPITIDASEFTSYTAASQPGIDAGNDDVATGDLIAIDVDAIGSTTAGKGLGVIMGFQLP